jgi:tetratricopeptide (TPR) repeat protein
LEQADYAAARRAFQDAIARAPYWAYPRHNLGLADLQAGDYDAAIQAYREAARLAPRYAYLRYNLGLIYQRINRRQDAEEAFRGAIAIDPQFADSYNALGYLKAAYGQVRLAEQLYRDALARNGDLLSARQNLAVLLWRDARRQGEALVLWKENLARDSGYLPTLLALGRALASKNEMAEAIAIFSRVAEIQPDYAAGRRALAELYLRAGDWASAMAQVQAALAAQGSDLALLELRGDIQALQGASQAAAASYREALVGAERADRIRLQKKLRRKAPR